MARVLSPFSLISLFPFASAWSQGRELLHFRCRCRHPLRRYRSLFSLYLFIFACFRPSGRSDVINADKLINDKERHPRKYQKQSEFSRAADRIEWMVPFCCLSAVSKSYLGLALLSSNWRLTRNSRQMGQGSIYRSRNFRIQRN